MNNLVQCTRCKKKMIHEEFDSHLCDTHTEDSEDVEISFYTITKGESEDTIIATGLNGVLYMLVRHKRSEMALSDESYRKLDPDDKLTEP